MRGNITRRGKASWRIKFDAEPDTVTGERRIHYATVKGKRADAEAELARLLNDAHRGTLIDLSRVTVASYLHSWLDGKLVDADDSDDVRLDKAMVTLVSILIAGMSFAWIAIYLAIGLPRSAAIPFVYQLCVVASLVVFARTKRIRAIRAILLVLMLALPFGALAGSRTVPP